MNLGQSESQFVQNSIVFWAVTCFLTPREQQQQPGTRPDFVANVGPEVARSVSVWYRLPRAVMGWLFRNLVCYCIMHTTRLYMTNNHNKNSKCTYGWPKSGEGNHPEQTNLQTISNKHCKNHTLLDTLENHLKTLHTKPLHQELNTAVTDASNKQAVFVSECRGTICCINWAFKRGAWTTRAEIRFPVWVCSNKAGAGELERNVTVCLFLVLCVGLKPHFPGAFPAF